MRRIAIIGGGVIGSAVAYWLTRLDDGLEVTVLERDPSYAQASSALSASSIRQQFSTPVNVAIGRFGIEFLRAVGEHLAVDGEAPEIGLHEGGYLFLATASGEAILRRNHEVQRAHGAETVLLEREALRRRFPWLALDDIALGSLGLAGEGWFDGYALLRAFRRRAIAQGARYRHTAVVGAVRERSRITELALSDGTRQACDRVINAAGPWAGAVAALLGIELPVHARRRTVFVLDCAAALPGCPLLIDPSGFWLRPEGGGFLCGLSPGQGEPDPDDLPLEPDWALFEERLWPRLAARIPAMEQLRLRSAWAGYYEVNSFDQNGLVGRHPALDNVWFANGFSGHGIQQAPAVGRGLAELILDGRYTSLDLSALGLGRLVDGRPLREQAVI
jgi:glycine/D-amino acid oxidase-like deaminating enzyme